MGNKTITWATAQSAVKALNIKNVDNFVDFRNNLPQYRAKIMYEKLAELTITLPDQTEAVSKHEIECLDAAATVSVIQQLEEYLLELDANNATPVSHWIFADDAKNTVIHFVRHGRWSAEMYCQSNCNFSAIHLLGESKFAIPVLFGNVQKQIERAMLSRDVFVSRELPRDKGDLLSKGGKKGKFLKKKNKYENRHDSL